VRVAVVNGAGVRVDGELFVRWCGVWGAEVGADVVPVFADDVAAALADGAEGADGIVVSPGAGGATPALVELARVPTVWVDLAAADRPLAPALDDAGTMVIRGRGVWGYRWAVAHLLQRLSYVYETIAYRPTRDHVGDLRLPAGEGLFAVVVLLHGGFWRERWERDTIEPLAVDLARRGYATWSLEYRRVGPLGGGWPTTCLDVAAGIDHLVEFAEERRLDLERVIVVGHSVGGQLALWAVKRAGVPGPPRVRPALAVSLAGINDLVEANPEGRDPWSLKSRQLWTPSVDVARSVRICRADRSRSAERIGGEEGRQRSLNSRCSTLSPASISFILEVGRVASGCLPVLTRGRGDGCCCSRRIQPLGRAGHTRTARSRLSRRALLRHRLQHQPSQQRRPDRLPGPAGALAQPHVHRKHHGRRLGDARVASRGANQLRGYR
jgi:hypothetical protein